MYIPNVPAKNTLMFFWLSDCGRRNIMPQTKNKNCSDISVWVGIRESRGLPQDTGRDLEPQQRAAMAAGAVREAAAQTKRPHQQAGRAGRASLASPEQDDGRGHLTRRALSPGGPPCFREGEQVSLAYSTRT